MDDDIWQRLEMISPFVRVAKITKSYSLAGEWCDSDHVFTYIEQGNADFILSGVRYRVGPGDAIVMPPFMQHFIHSTSHEALIQYIFHFDLHHRKPAVEHWRGRTAPPMYLGPPAPDELALSGLNPISHIRMAERADVKRCFLKMHQEFTKEHKGFTLLLKSAAIELLSMFLRSQMQVEWRRGDLTKGWSFIQSCISFVHEQYADVELNNHKISQYVGVSTNYLSFLFREQTGITVHRYVTHVRIEQAKRLILENRWSLTQIADMCGFSSIHVFSRAFRHATGVTASQYLALHSDPTLKHGGQSGQHDDYLA